MKRAAVYGNGWHPVGAIPANPLEPIDVVNKLSLLYDYAKQANRDSETLEIAMKAPLYDSESGPSTLRRRFGGDAQEILEDVRAYSESGVTHLIFDIRGNDLNQALEKLQWFAEDVMAVA